MILFLAFHYLYLDNIFEYYHLSFFAFFHIHLEIFDIDNQVIHHLKDFYYFHFVVLIFLYYLNQHLFLLNFVLLHFDYAPFVFFFHLLNFYHNFYFYHINHQYNHFHNHNFYFYLFPFAFLILHVFVFLLLMYNLYNLDKLNYHCHLFLYLHHHLLDQYNNCYNFAYLYLNKCWDRFFSYIYMMFEHYQVFLINCHSSHLDFFHNHFCILYLYCNCHRRYLLCYFLCLNCPFIYIFNSLGF